MFQFPSLPPAPYGFRYGYRRITSGEFPHSEIPGSMTGQRLPRAYRSRPRPSSALGAKASIVCSCSLDQKNTGIDVAMEFSRCGRRRDSRSFKAQQRGYVEVDMLLGELGSPTGLYTVLDNAVWHGNNPSRGRTPTGVNRRLP